MVCGRYLDSVWLVSWAALRCRRPNTELAAECAVAMPELLSSIIPWVEIFQLTIAIGKEAPSGIATRYCSQKDDEELKGVYLSRCHEPAAVPEA